MKLNQLFDIKLLEQHLLNRVVSEMRHPEFKNLAIYNYTHTAQHDNIWDEVTEQTRGLIVDTDTGEVLARPFRKFFNLNTSFRPETLEANLPSWKPRVLEKLDGSLGILYWWHGKPYIATRGSFASDQAKWATDWYRTWEAHHQEMERPRQWPEGYTPLFEIIYKENRIVVNYDYEGLALLGLVNIETGNELSPEQVQEIAKRNGLYGPRLFHEHTLEQCVASKEGNTEGFVLQYWSSENTVPLRIKIKTEEYTRLHKVITGLNPKGIWEHLSLGYNPEALWSPVSSNKGFTEWCINWIQTFQTMYSQLESAIISSFGQVSIRARQEIVNSPIPLDARATRKAYALSIQQEPSHFSSALWAIYDGKDYKPAIWKLIEPKIQGKEVFITDADQFEGL